MTYRGVVRGRAAESAEPGSKARRSSREVIEAVLRAVQAPPHVSKEDVDALEAEIEAGKLPVRFEGIFDEEGDQDARHLPAPAITTRRREDETMGYRGVVRGSTIELDSAPPFSDGQPVEVWLEPRSESMTAGSPAAIRRAMCQPPRVTAEDVDALEAEIEAGKLPVRFEGIFDEDTET